MADTRCRDYSHWKEAAKGIARDWPDHSKKAENGQKAVMLVRILLADGAFEPTENNAPVTANKG